jgi:hypothetical protein
MVINQKDALQQKINTFIQDNHITCLKKDRTETFQKQLQQALQICNLLIEITQHDAAHTHITQGKSRFISVLLIPI